MSAAFPPELLRDNLRCKIIYYSCLNPHTITDLNTAWGYSSPTYLYQQNAMERLKEADLITVEKVKNSNVITANYDALFDDKVVEASREDINQEILKEFLVQAKGFHPQQEHAADETDLLNIGRGNLDVELEADLQDIEFTRREFDTLIGLWETDLFRETFLGLDIVTRLFGETKDRLPDNPLDYLFRLTAGTADAVNRVQGEDAADIPPGLTYRAEKVIVPVYRVLQGETGSASYDTFVDRMNDAYSLFRTKFRQDRFNYAFIGDFAELTMQTEDGKRFGSLLKKYRGDDAFF